MADAPSDTVGIWECAGPHGERITVTSLEAQAVKAWAEGMLRLMEVWGKDTSKCCREFLTGFLVGAATSDDESAALGIAAGRIEECRHGDRPMMATLITEAEATALADDAKAPKARRFRSW